MTNHLKPFHISLVLLLGVLGVFQSGVSGEPGKPKYLEARFTIDLQNSDIAISTIDSLKAELVKRFGDAVSVRILTSEDVIHTRNLSVSNCNFKFKLSGSSKADTSLTPPAPTPPAPPSPGGSR